MPTPWPPPPDLASIQELVRAADPEKHLAEGAPADEYEPEERAIFDAIRRLATDQLLATNLMATLKRIWQQSFNLNEDALAERLPALLSLAKEIERFFGPESKPRTRADILRDDEQHKAAG